MILSERHDVNVYGAGIPGINAVRIAHIPARNVHHINGILPGQKMKQARNQNLRDKDRAERGKDDNRRNEG